jgi:protein CpxP
MRYHILWSLAIVLTPLSPLSAQRDSAAPRSDSLRQRIEERFASRVQEQLGLSNEQATKLRATMQQYGTRHRELRQRHRQLREALTAQLRPGVAANQDSVAKLTDAMIELRIASAQAARDEMRDVSKYLTPVQRARLVVMRDRLHDRMKDAHERHGMRGGSEGRYRGRERPNRMAEPHQ